MTMMVARVVIELRQPSVEGVDDRTLRSVVPVARSRQSFECRPHSIKSAILSLSSAMCASVRAFTSRLLPLILPQAQQ